MKTRASAMGIFKSVVSTCEAVGKACGRRAISDRDMRSERPGFERCPLPVCHWAGLRCGPDKHSEIEKKCKVEKLPDSVVKSETANAQSVLCLVHLRPVQVRLIKVLRSDEKRVKSVAVGWSVAGTAVQRS